MKSGLWRFCLTLLGIIVFVAMAICLEQYVGVPVAITFRVACASACLFLIVKVSGDYPGKRWPRVAFLLALACNISLFFSPLAKLPPSKGDLLMFGAPDAVILLTARIVSYPVANIHQRAVRQQMILGLILALAFCAILLGMMCIPATTKR